MQLNIGGKIRFRPNHIVIRKNESWVQSLCLMLGEVFWFFPTRLYDLIRAPVVTVLAHTGMFFLLLAMFAISRVLLLILGLSGYLCYAENGVAEGKIAEKRDDEPDLE